MGQQTTCPPNSLVLVVEDEESLRAAISSALQVRDIAHKTATNSDDALALLENLPPVPVCLLLDIRLGTGPSGLTVFDALTQQGLINRVPVIFMTGHGDIDTAVDVMRAGAFDFVSKPFSTPQLIDKITDALLSSRKIYESDVERQRLTELLGELTPKEEQVMRLMIEGKTNREIAEQCGNSTRTVELHRARVFEKLKVSNAVDLVRKLGVLEK